jgi:ABC-2 type transport system ATP-binding protein
MDRTLMARTPALRAAAVATAACAVAAAPVAIRFCAVAKRYRSREVLREVSFEVAQGSSVAIAGVNGAGKSTLLRCLLDFARPDSGQIFIGHRDSNHLHARAQLGWLPERFVPPAHLTARECLQWLAGLRGRPLNVLRMETVAAELGFEARALSTRVRDLSKGTVQKLGLMSIAMADAPIWVLDEPMSGLDPLARRNVMRLIDSARAAGRTVVFTTHGLRDLPAVCDRLVVLHDGAVRFSGTLEDFASRYGSTDLELAFLACLQDEAPAVSAPTIERASEGCPA